jgi:hypothetical protein
MQAMVDAMKPLFGLNRMVTRRLRLSGRIRRRNPAAGWRLPDGGPNYRVEQVRGGGGLAEYARTARDGA